MATLLTILLLVGFLVAVILRPGRAVAASVTAVVTAVVLIEGAGIGPRLAVGLAIALAALILFGRRGGARIKVAQPARSTRRPVQDALARLTGQVGLLTRNRVLTLRRRVDLALASEGTHDPTSEYTMLRIKLERRVPELIDVALADLPRTSGARRRALTGELLDDVEGLLDRLEAADPDLRARADRRAALRNHLRGASEE